MKENFYLVGAGAFAREIYSYLSVNNFELNNYMLAGFTNDDRGYLDKFSLEHKIHYDLFATDIPKNARLVMAVADPSLKEKLHLHYKELGHEFLSFIHPSALVGSRVIIGEGAIICPNVVLTADISIGSCVTINMMSSIGHDVKIGDFSTLSAHCDTTGFVELGEKVFLGSHVTVIPKVKVGDNAIIGAGSVVISRVKSGVTVFGNPARKIK